MNSEFEPHVVSFNLSSFEDARALALIDLMVMLASFAFYLCSVNDMLLFVHIPSA